MIIAKSFMLYIVEINIFQKYKTSLIQAMHFYLNQMLLQSVSVPDIKALVFIFLNDLATRTLAEFKSSCSSSMYVVSI